MNKNMSKFKKILYLCDILGLDPKLRIFGKDKYKSTCSSILSIIVLFLAATFTVYSLIVYFNYVNPSIVYSKDNEKSTIRTIPIKNALLMFGLYENTDFSVLDSSDAFIEVTYRTSFNNGTSNTKNLALEKCVFGKNIEEKHRDALKDLKINEYYCFNNNDGNLALFYDPEEGKSSLSLNIRIKKNSQYTANNIIIYIVNGNGIIDHSNKNDPISNNYFTSTYASFSTTKFNIINYYLQFIKYESDDGFLFPNEKIFQAKAFSQMNIMETNYIEAMDKTEIGTIFISFSEINFDSYKRVYQRIQSLIAEITSVVNLLIAIGKIVTSILLEKKMNKDIFEYIGDFEFNKRKIEIPSENKEIISRESNLRNIGNKIEDSNNVINKQNSIDNLTNKKETNNGSTPNTFDNLSYLDYIKSFFCCKDEYTQLINDCHEYILKEICIENILKNIFELEYKFNIISENNTFDKRMEEIQKIICKNKG